jgi:hypothetical protein
MEDNDDLSIFDFYESDEDEIEEIDPVYGQQPELESPSSDNNKINVDEVKKQIQNFVKDGKP